MRKIYHSIPIISSFLIILVSMFLTRNVEAGNSIYHNSENHFSFKIPDGWMKIPQNVLDKCTKLLEQQANKANVSLPYAFRPIAVFQLKKSNNWPDIPYFNIVIDQGKISESAIKELIASGEYKEAFDEGISEVGGIFPSIVNSLKIGKPIYDDKRNVFLSKGSSFVTGIGKVTSLVAGFLGSEIQVNFGFYSLESDFQKYMLDFSEVIDSFKFDLGYEYKLNTRPNKLVAKILGIICILFGIAFIPVARRFVSAQSAVMQATIFQFNILPVIVGIALILFGNLWFLLFGFVAGFLAQPFVRFFMYPFPMIAGWFFGSHISTHLYPNSKVWYFGGGIIGALSMALLCTIVVGIILTPTRRP